MARPLESYYLESTHEASCKKMVRIERRLPSIRQRSACGRLLGLIINLCKLIRYVYKEMSIAIEGL